MDQKHIRNFSIIAHIDHGKSTLADRLIQSTGTVSERDMQDQLLDNMDIERERGITIKLQTCRMFYKYKGEEYLFNLIDTPGHVDFTYEVSRSLAACEGAILVVDASQGVEAQTLSNVYLALNNNLEILPVLNKIDLPSADIEKTKKEIEDQIGIDTEGCPEISAKVGLNIDKVLEQIVEKIPAPNGDENKPLKCLIFDSYYDNYLGTISMIRVFDGTVKAGDKITMMATGRSFEVVEVGIFNPGPTPTKQLTAGDVGYISASVKDVSECEVGDTITSATNPTKEPLPGYKKVLPMVYTGVYPADGARYNDLKEALLKLRLNDASLSFEPETSVALGFGFRCGFLGLLHMEVIEERLEREFNLDLITTTPSVKYKVTLTNGEQIIIENPTALPSPTEIDFIEEPVVKCSIYTPKEYIGSIMQLCQNKRGEYINLVYVDSNRCELLYRMPLNEIVYDFFDKLKSRSRGYASLDYEMDGYQKSNLIRLDMLINGEQCDALSIIVHKDFAYARGRALAERLKEVIPRQCLKYLFKLQLAAKLLLEKL